MGGPACGRRVSDRLGSPHCPLLASMPRPSDLKSKTVRLIYDPRLPELEYNLDAGSAFAGTEGRH
eukprot:30191-Eustigmatos_ZCMA.PRE.1